ncbi:MAG: polysaccharide biosynthesis/export family protein [Desulfovibrio sp.]|nr:polysaccharide biosynthesis/export family protein [Desulfovibrio sp.]
MSHNWARKTFCVLCAAALLLQGCSLMPHSGPSRSVVQDIEKDATPAGVKIITVNNEVAKRLGSQKKPPTLAEVFKETGKPSYSIGPGDSITVTIWEAAPAILFRTGALDPNLGAQAGAGEKLPPQMVMEDGAITIPFVGRVKVAGRTLGKIQDEIASKLSGLANNPQVMVSVNGSVNSQVSVIGDVKINQNIPLTPRGEKLLDALAAAGGVAQPLNKVLVQLSRRGVNARMPLDKIINDPEQNLSLMPGDVISAYFQPWTFSILGAANRSQEVPFEASGISLAQALSRSGGLNDYLADPGGVFVFRFEDPAVVEDKPEEIPLDGKIPVVYQVDFRDPASFFATQNFPMQDKDLIYVANMPAAELTKFLSMVGMVLTPSLSIGRYQIDATR